MTEPSGQIAASGKAIYGRITWGAYDQIFTLDAGTAQKFNSQDDHQTMVEVAAFDPKRYETTHPVKLTCTATGRFPLTNKLDEAFIHLPAGKLPNASHIRSNVNHPPH